MEYDFMGEAKAKAERKRARQAGEQGASSTKETVNVAMTKEGEAALRKWQKQFGEHLGFKPTADQSLLWLNRNSEEILDLIGH